MGSRARTHAAVLVVGLLFVGCGGGDKQPAPKGGSPAASDRAVVPAATDQTLVFPECDAAFVPERRFLGAEWRRTSTRVGPVRFLNTVGFAKPGLAGRRARKLRTLFLPGRSIEIEIEGSARSAVGFLAPDTIRWSGSRSDLHPAIRVENCPPIPPELPDTPAGRHYGYGIFVGVRRAACVPIAVTRNGGRSHRRLISFGRGNCAK
jgi:hypothetical protein